MSIAAAVAPFLLDIARKVGAPVVKSILEKQVGGAAGQIGGAIVDAIAGQAGVSPAELPGVPAKELEAAVAAVEDRAPEILAHYVESQRLSNKLQLEEMTKDTAFAWAWRPFWMWLLALLWAYTIMLRPLVNAATGASIEAADAGVLMTLTGAYLALYMGGHTIKDVAARWRAPS